MKRVPLASWMPALLALLFLAVGAGLARIESHEVWWHLRAGDWILEHRRIPDRNLFSSTAPDWPWVAHEWLTEVLFALAYRIAPGALVALKSLLVLALAFCLFAAGRAASQSAPAAAIAAGVTVVALQGWLDFRPQLVSYVLVAAVLWLLEDQDAGGPRRRLWLLAPLALVWANLHGGYLIGLALVAVGLVARPRDAGARVLPLALAGAASLLTPHGIWLPLFVVQLSRNAAFLEGINEWWPPDFRHPDGQMLEAMLLLTCVALAVARPRTRDVLFTLLFAHLALQHWRHIPLFLLVTTPLLARLWAEALACLAKHARAPRAAGWVVGLIAVVASGAWCLQQIPDGPAFPALVREERFPSGAVAFLRQAGLPRSGRLYNDYGWGGYLVWQRFPARGVFIDGRVDAYPPQVHADYRTIQYARPGWQALLDRHAVEVVLTRPASPIAQALAREPAWQLAYRDPVATVLLRRPATRH